MIGPAPGLSSLCRRRRRRRHGRRLHFGFGSFLHITPAAIRVSGVSGGVGWGLRLRVGLIIAIELCQLESDYSSQTIRVMAIRV